MEITVTPRSQVMNDPDDVCDVNDASPQGSNVVRFHTPHSHSVDYRRVRDLQANNPGNVRCAIAQI